MKESDRYLKKLRDGYRLTGVTLLNVLLVFILLNAILFLVFAVKDYFVPNPVSARYGDAIVNDAYQELDDEEVGALLHETWSRPYLYEPFIQFRERPFQGYYVNVDSNGFRITKNQGPWPPQSTSLNIFLFGGSTTFGYGVQDDQTIASHMQAYLSEQLNREVRVYNFGQGHYYSTQERILYEQLLASGFVPDIAVFIDGLNDFVSNSDKPLFTHRLSEFMSGRSVAVKLRDLALTKFISRIVLAMNNRLSRWLPGDDGQLRREFDDPELLDSVIPRYTTNKRMIEAISGSFGVRPVFVWQPIPMYHYEQRYHPFSEGGYGQHSYARYGYKRMADFIVKNSLGDNFLWCADIQKDEKRGLYIDRVHYSGSFSKKFAIFMADLLIEKHLQGN